MKLAKFAPLGIVLLIVGGLFYDRPQAASTAPALATVATPAPTYAPPAEIQPVLSRLGITDRHIQFVPGSCVNADTPTAVACFVQPNIIHYQPSFPGMPPLEVNALIAHEYLHYVWFTTPQSEKDRLTPYIEQTYQANQSYLDQRLSGYHFTSDAQRVDELHSYIGTELDDSVIPPPLLDHYKLYTNRQALPSLYPARPAPQTVQPQHQCITTTTTFYDQVANKLTVTPHTYCD